MTQNPILRSYDKKLLLDAYREDENGSSPLRRMINYTYENLTTEQIIAMFNELEAMGPLAWIDEMDKWGRPHQGSRLAAICLWIAVDSLVRSGGVSMPQAA